MAENNHITEEQLNQLHKQGACLSRHQKRQNGHKCSHQWQAKEKTEANPGMYNHPKYHSFCASGSDNIFKTAARLGKKSGNLFPADYGIKLETGGFWKEKPTCDGKEWDVGGDNFDHWTKPYWHNSHHIVPNRVLAAAIQKASEEAKRPDLVNIIKAGLLKAEYNLNDQLNMINLPMEKAVGAALDLPRHLLGDEVGPNEKKEFRSHENYSAKIEQKLVGVMNNFKKALAKSTEPDHLPPPDQLSKKQLEQVSIDIFEKIKNGGSAIGGKALAEIANIL